jgi:hypothetical protein
MKLLIIHFVYPSDTLPSSGTALCCQTLCICFTFEIFKALKTTFFWDMMLCSLVDRYLSTKLHGFISQDI